MVRILVSGLVTLAFGVDVRAADVDYLRDVKPILAHHCYACHGALKQQGGLRLDTAAAAVRGGDSGAAVTAGEAAESLLIQAVTGEAGFRMPPEGEGTPLSEEQIELLRTWIRAGAPVPDDEPVPADPATFWSFQPPVRPPVPEVGRQAWIRTPVDAFIAARHEALGVAPRKEADRATWLRRVHLDLVGLPPTREELRTFLNDSAPDAYERTVDDLLSRPQYGERWGRHWMDVWRYSDWYGSRAINEIRYSQRHIWRWRDWIVESLNSDKGYDQMIVEMLAGDEVAAGDPDILRATGFLGRNWYKFDRNVWMFETVEQTAQAFLATTLRCCRCHDHKYDPITQQEYYEFRAFFEPHDVRTDRLSLSDGTQKDATLGEVPLDGVARVFDKTIDVPTYLFSRGDDRYPDKEHPLSPGVPAALGGDSLDVQPVALAALEFYPSLRPELLTGIVAQGRQRIADAGAAVETARQKANEASQRADEAMARVQQGAPLAAAPAPFLQEDFSIRHDDRWQVVSGDWAWEEGRLVEKAVAGFATLMGKENHPRDFRARAKYRTLAAGTTRSVGFSFDCVDQGNSQDVYTSANDAAPSVQAFHRSGGQQHYPQAGIVMTPLKPGELVTLEWEVRGQELKLWMNGEHKLDYVLPIPRQDGKLALWVHRGSAEFLELEVVPLIPTIEDLQRGRQRAVDAVALAERRQKTADAEFRALEARIAAERAKYLGGAAEAIASTAREASRAERLIAVAEAEEAVLAAEQARALAGAGPAAESVATETALNEQSSAAEGTPVASPPAVSEAETRLNEARAALAVAQTAAENPDGVYAPLGEIFPATSTGRRLALARWMGSAGNPRTARVAVNQIWLRHFGAGLVPSVANFGLNGEHPTHPQLLDWLAVELMENGWQMKPLHRMLVLSATYRQSSRRDDFLDSADPAAAHGATLDPDNRTLWRMNSRRMEAEVVRDSILYAANRLDLTPGGPELPDSDGDRILRRSLYFRNTPNERMKLLEVFDMANPNECYRRRESVVPQQALALMNSSLALDNARLLAGELSAEAGATPGAATDEEFLAAAFERILSRPPTGAETAACRTFLAGQAAAAGAGDRTPFPAGGASQQPPSDNPAQRARENLVHVLFSHNDFVTVR